MVKNKILEISIISIVLLIVTAIVGIACFMLISELDIPLRSEIILRDSFRISLVTDKLCYRKSELNKDEPFDFKVAVEYIGNDNEIEIWHAKSVSLVEILDKSGEPVVLTGMNQPLLSSTIKSGEKLEEVFTGKGYDGYFEVEGGDFRRGHHTVKVYINFSLNEELTDEISCVMNLPLVII